MSEHIVIVGAGQAAAQAVQTLRQRGCTAQLTLVGDEPHLPYQRPPLSKKYLAGTFERTRLYLRPAEFYAERDVELELGVTVESLNLKTRELGLGNGRTLTYDRLLLTTGSHVRRLDVPGATLKGVHYIRTIADADRLRAALAHSDRVAIVGGGYIGLEAAAVAVGMGRTVTLLEAGPRLMHRTVGEAIATCFQLRHTHAGVTIHCDSPVAAFEGTARVEAVLDTSGRRHECDLVIVGVGVKPRTEIAISAGLACDDGIIVDAHARTSDPQVFAAGDCTRHPSTLTGTRVRLESVQNAIEQARIAAGTILGDEKPYVEVPWFWSDQYDIKLQIAGLTTSDDQVVIRGTPDRPPVAAFHLRGGRLIAVEAVNSPREFMHGRRLIAAGASPSPMVLADPSADLAGIPGG